MAITKQFRGSKIVMPGAGYSLPVHKGEYSSIKINDCMQDGKVLEEILKTMVKLDLLEEARILISKDMIGPRLDYMLEIWV